VTEPYISMVPPTQFRMADTVVFMKIRN